VPLPLIAREVGTPVYVYSAAAMRAQAGALKAALAPLADPLIAYAVKANPNPAVVSTFAREGLGADVVSAGEYACARAAGIAADRIVFSGVGKTAAEMELALGGGLAQFNLDRCRKPRCCRRWRCRWAALRRSLCGSIPTSRRGRTPRSPPAPPTTSSESRSPTLSPPAPGSVSCPASSSRASPSISAASSPALRRSRRRSKGSALIRALRADGHSIATADLGGGLGLAYDPAAPPPPSPAEYGAMIARVTRDWNARLIFEPGRLLVGAVGVLLTTVIRVKPGPALPFVIVDAAMNDLMRPTLYDAWHAAEAVVPGGEEMVADIVGPICETGDTFARSRRIDRVAAGELMVLRTAGAYAATMGSTYNSRPLTPEVLVNVSDWAVVRARQPVEALYDYRLPPWLGESLLGEAGG